MNAIRHLISLTFRISIRLIKGILQCAYDCIYFGAFVIGAS